MYTTWPGDAQVQWGGGGDDDDEKELWRCNSLSSPTVLERRVSTSSSPGQTV